MRKQKAQENYLHAFYQFEMRVTKLKLFGGYSNKEYL